MITLKVNRPQAKKDVETPTNKVPFLAFYGGEKTIVLVTKPGLKVSEGYMVTPNSVYQPFEYFSTGWASDALTVINDPTMTITVP